MQLLDLAQSAHRVHCILNDSFQTWDDLSHENREGWMRLAKFFHALGETISGTSFKDLGVLLWDEFSSAKGAEPPGKFGRLVWEGIARHLGALADDALDDEDVPLGTLEESWLEWLTRQKVQRPYLEAIAGS